MKLRYEMDGEEYVFFDGDDELFRTEHVAIAFSVSSGLWTMHKHGQKAIVDQWAEVAKKKYIEAGYQNLADEIFVVSGVFPVDDLNRILSTTGFIKTFCERYCIDTCHLKN